MSVGTLTPPPPTADAHTVDAFPPLTDERLVKLDRKARRRSGGQGPSVLLTVLLGGVESDG
jgi:hypothetical protein